VQFVLDKKGEAVLSCPADATPLRWHPNPPGWTAWLSGLKILLWLNDYPRRNKILVEASDVLNHATPYLLISDFLLGRLFLNLQKRRIGGPNSCPCVSPAT
jgi:hypothetical protein